MSLIDCPECTREVSSHATSCPGCGFPVARAMQESVEELTGPDASTVFRGKAAGHNLNSWANRYSDHPEEIEKPTRKSALIEKTTRIAIFAAVVLVVVLQLLWLSSAL